MRKAQECPKPKNCNITFLILSSEGIFESPQEAAEPHIWPTPCTVARQMATDLELTGLWRCELFNLYKLVSFKCVLKCACVRKVGGFCRDCCQALTPWILRLKDETLKASWVCRVHRVIRFGYVQLSFHYR